MRRPIIIIIFVIDIVITIMFNTYPERHPAEVSPAKIQTGVVTSDLIHPYCTAAILDLKWDSMAINKYYNLKMVYAFISPYPSEN